MKHTILKISGIIVLVTGLVLTVIGAIDFFNVMGSMDGRPEYFWLMPVGFPMIGIGGMLLAFGFRPHMQRHVQRRLQDLWASTQAQAVCPCCARTVEKSANFCPQCGAKMPR